MDDHQKQTFQFIQQGFDRGMSESAIRRQLQASGWSLGAIDTALRGYYASLSDDAAPVFQRPEPPVQPQQFHQPQPQFQPQPQPHFEPQPRPQPVQRPDPEPAQPVQAAHYQPPPVQPSRSRMKKLHLGLPKMPKKALLLAGVAIVLLVGLGGWLILKPSGTAKQAADSSSKGGSSASSGGLETLSLQANALNTARKNDISSIAAAINEIESNNNGVPPKSTSTNAALGMLVICGDDCFGTHAASIKLGQYANSADAVKYATYINTLAVPNINTVYIVNGATCKADNSGIGDKGLDRNVAILYALQTSSGIGPQCLAAS